MIEQATENKSNISEDFEYLGFWNRMLMAIIEILVVSVPFVFLYRSSIKISINIESVIPFILQWLLIDAILVVMITRYGATPGKLIMKARIVDRNGNHLSVVRSILRMVIYSLNSIFLVLALDVAIRNNIAYEEVGKFINNYEGEELLMLKTLVGFVGIIDILWLLFNRRKRTLHDILAGSYVITKESYLKSKERKSSYIS
jgi:uncharacterized RDD family membrane protein YckC